MEGNKLIVVTNGNERNIELMDHGCIQIFVQDGKAVRLEVSTKIKLDK